MNEICIFAARLMNRILRIGAAIFTTIIFATVTFMTAIFTTVIFTAALFAAAIPAFAQTAADDSFSPQQRAALRELFAAFPDAESLSAARAQIGADIKRRTIGELRDNKTLPTFGAADGPLIVEFSDYQCGYCKRMFPLLRDENARVKVVEFPVLGALSRTAARYALASQKQNRYEDFHIALMNRGGRLTEEGLREAADAAGLDWEQLQRDGESAEITAALRENHRLAKLMEVRGTPFLIVGERAVPGAISKERLQQLLSAASP